MTIGAKSASLLDEVRDAFGNVIRILAKASFAVLLLIAALIIAGGAAVVGLILAAAAVVLRFTMGAKPRRARPAGATLEAHRTPSGWVVDPR